MSNFLFLHNFVSFARRSMCDISMERCVLGFYFFLHLRALSNLWGRYDLKTKQKSFWLVTVSFLYTESNVVYLLKGRINTFISASYTNKL